jgi:formylglycine-generating enzyme required for sulfatase activity
MDTPLTAFGALLLIVAAIICSATPSRAEPAPGMALVPAGEFLMGADKRPVMLPAFYIDVNEVTNRQYQAGISIMIQKIKNPKKRRRTLYNAASFTSVS